MALTSAIASAYLSVSRWKLSTQPLPDKVIVIGAPHTSNWDGVFMAISMWKSGRSFSFLVKDSVVKAPVLGWFVKKIGAVPVERSAAHGLVEFLDGRVDLKRVDIHHRHSPSEQTAREGSSSVRSSP